MPKLTVAPEITVADPDVCGRNGRRDSSVSQSEVGSHEVEHEVIQQLMDFKLIHVIEPDTSAASGRTGRSRGIASELRSSSWSRGCGGSTTWSSGRQMSDVDERASVRRPCMPWNGRVTYWRRLADGEAQSVIEGIEAIVGVDTNAGEPAA